MVAPSSPKLALGEMAMRLHAQIAEHMPNLLVNPHGPKKIWPLIVQLDGLLISYRKSMNYFEYDPKNEKVPKTTSYYKMKAKLDDRLEKLDFNSTKDRKEWVKYFGDYLHLLSSCFNVIGLAPAEWSPGQEDSDSNLEEGLKRVR